MSSTDDKVKVTPASMFNKISTALHKGDAGAVDELFSTSDLDTDAPETESDGAPETETSTEDDATVKSEGDTEKTEPTTEAANGGSTSDDADWTGELPEGAKEKALGLLNAVETLTKQNELLIHKTRSDSGRVSALQKQIDALKNAKDAIDNRSNAAPKEQKELLDAASKTLDTELIDDETLEQLKESDPTLYKVIKQREKLLSKAVQDRISTLESSIEEKLQKSTQPFVDGQRKQKLDNETNLLKQKVPNAAEVITSPYWESFVDASSPGVKALANSADHLDVIEAMRLYTSWLSDSGLISGTGASNAPAATQQPAASTNVAATRQRKLEGADADKGKKTPTHTSDMEIDVDELLKKDFEAIVKKEGLFRRG